MSQAEIDRDSYADTPTRKLIDLWLRACEDEGRADRARKAAYDAHQRASGNRQILEMTLYGRLIPADANNVPAGLGTSAVRYSDIALLAEGGQIRRIALSEPE